MKYAIVTFKLPDTLTGNPEIVITLNGVKVQKVLPVVVDTNDL